MDAAKWVPKDEQLVYEQLLHVSNKGLCHDNAIMQINLSITCNISVYRFSESD